MRLEWPDNTDTAFVRSGARSRSVTRTERPIPAVSESSELAYWRDSFRMKHIPSQYGGFSRLVYARMPDDALYGQAVRRRAFHWMYARFSYAVSFEDHQRQGAYGCFGYFCPAVFLAQSPGPVSCSISTTWRSIVAIRSFFNRCSSDMENPPS